MSNHQGTCSWKDNDNDGDVDEADATDSKQTALVNGLAWLPAACIQSQTPVADGSSSYLYFDLQPKYGGSFDVGLYTDSSCLAPYTFPKDSTVTVSSVLSTYYGYEIDAATSVSTFNTLLDDFKVCQPCRTYDVSNNVADDNGNLYVCNDSAGYYGVNMCSMFATTTTIETASFHDVSKASSQTTIVRTYAATDVVESWWQKWGFLLISSLVFVFGLLCFCSVAVKRKRTVGNSRKALLFGSNDRQEPLIGN